MSKTKPFSLKRVMIVTVFAVLGICVSVISLFLFAVYRADTTPEFFPLDDDQATYTITKRCPEGQGSESRPGITGSAYCLEYQGEHAWRSDTNPDSKFFSISIGHSQIDLEPFLNRQVTNIDGTFTSSSRQCILTECIDFSTKYAVLDLYSLSLVP